MEAITLTDKTIPFDLERALAGDRVITRNGDDVTQLHTFKLSFCDAIFGVINNQVIDCSGCDLYMASKPCR